MSTEYKIDKTMASYARDFRIPGTLIPGKVNKRYFQLLVNISCIRNDSMREALACVMISGMKRKDACELHGVSQSHFSIKYRDLQVISQTIVRMYQYIPNESEKL
ncbi:TPA: transcriptional regulator [Escherichia coli]|nr:transcriptional regulator [Escherichia coli]